MNEIQEVNGGINKLPWKSISRYVNIVITGYEIITSIDWGDSSDDEDTNLAP